MDLKKIKLMNKVETLEELSFNDVIKKPNKQGQLVEEKKEVECPDWKRSLEIAYAEKQ